MVTIGNHGRCKYCDMEQLFQVKTTNGPSPSTKAYSIRGGQTAAKRRK
jgi:hypothetical protein